MQYKTVNVNFNIHIPKVNFTLVGLTFGFLVVGFAALNVTYILSGNGVFVVDMMTSIIIASIGSVWVVTRLLEESSLQSVKEEYHGPVYPSEYRDDYNGYPVPVPVSDDRSSGGYTLKNIPMSDLTKDIPPLEPEKQAA